MTKKKQLIPEEHRKVFIVGNQVNYAKMFHRNGWQIVDDLRDAMVVQFTGGDDVSPFLYGEEPHPKTQSNFVRDMREIAIFEAARDANKVLAGICRGGQFLNVMMGGKLEQHIVGHDTGLHSLTIPYHIKRDVELPEKIDVTSTHHQAMIPSSRAKILCYEYNSKTGRNVHEVVTYQNGRVICNQSHPELQPKSNNEKFYFHLIDKGYKVCVA